MKLDSVIFYSNDIAKAVDFYQNFLGLKLDYVSGDSFASFSFDNGVKLGIKKAVEDREIPGAQSLFILVENNISELFKQYQKREARFYKELVENKFGVTFSILDPDNNKVLFIQSPKS